jgi:cytochrome c oxidase assembly protein subunit 15
MRNWLIVVAAMIFLMIVLGALTRLTESGLSIVEWKPITGWLPPVGEQAWQAELQKYLSSPQGRLVNRGFDVADFRQIFWLEYLHRLWGRLIGVAVALPLLWFWLRGQLPAWLKPRLFALLVLGGLQGALGWAMVASGLIDRPSVSHYRLAAHLLLAVALYGYTVWLVLELGAAARRDDTKTGREAARLIAGVLVVMTFGALMAGLRAGTAHNTFPTMSGYWIPPGLLELSPWWINLFENGTTIQFIHRWLAMFLVLRRTGARRSARAGRNPCRGRHGADPACLGIATILSGVDIAVAAAHQAGRGAIAHALWIVCHRRVLLGHTPCRLLSEMTGEPVRRFLRPLLQLGLPLAAVALAMTAPPSSPRHRAASRCRSAPASRIAGSDAPTSRSTPPIGWPCRSTICARARPRRREPRHGGAGATPHRGHRRAAGLRSPALDGCCARPRPARRAPPSMSV